MPAFTKGKWKYIPVLYQVVSFPEGKEFDIVDGAHVFWDNNAPALWHEITGEINGLNNSDEEAHANGRLIAEAPVMYEVIQNLLGYANKACNEAFKSGNKEKAHHIAEDIRNALNVLDCINGKAWDALPDDHPLRYDIDACLCHVEGSLVPGEEDE